AWAVPHWQISSKRPRQTTVSPLHFCVVDLGGISLTHEHLRTDVLTKGSVVTPNRWNSSANHTIVMSLTRVGRLRPSVLAITTRCQSTHNVFALVMGGGVAGSSVAYHLTKRNIKDVILLEKEGMQFGLQRSLFEMTIPNDHGVEEIKTCLF
ncbi:hypothetical protein GCK32_013991, partial [Trichostrongylus colubriformis]